MDEAQLISNRMEKLFLSSQWCDLEFCLTNSQTGKPELLQAHRIILASASPVFEVLCYGPLAERGVISVPDIESDAFKLVLNFLYTDKIKFESAEVASNVMYTAKKYWLPNLVNLAQKYLLSNISDRNCVDLYNLAIMLECHELEQKTMDHIRRRMNFILDFIDDSNLSSNLIRALVTSTEINCEELALVKLAHRWALNLCDSTNLENNEENMRNIMVQNDIFKNIRWHALVESDLNFFKPEVFSKDEIFQCSISHLPLRKTLPLMPVLVHRCIEAEGDFSSYFNFPDFTVSTSVKVNKALTLGGIFIKAKHYNGRFPCRNIPDYEEKMEINIYKGPKIILSQKICLHVFYGISFKVQLAEKITLKENCSYDCCLTLYSAMREYRWTKMSRLMKTPSGIEVKCSESINGFPDHHPPPSRYLGLITGFEFFY